MAINNLLYIEASQEWIDIGVRHFTRFSQKVHIARDAESALEKIGENKYDCIVSDSLHGDFFSIVRHLGANDINARVILFSSEQESIREAKRKGIETYKKDDTGYDLLVDKLQKISASSS